MSVFTWFETRINPFGDPNLGVVRPPNRLWPFIWHYIRQVWGWFGAILVVGFLVAVVEVSLFAFLGDVVDWARGAESPEAFWAQHGSAILVMGAVVAVLRPVLLGLHAALKNQVMTPNLSNLIRWQTHRYVLRQSVSFFHNDFAGRVANKIMQTGPALRESVMQAADALWYVGIYTLSALVLFAENDWRLTLPLVLWLALFSWMLYYFVPKIGALSAELSEARSQLTGRIVDSYTNITTLKLFADPDREDQFAREAMAALTDRFHAQLRMITAMEWCMWLMSSWLIAGTGGLALYLWSLGEISIGAVALTIGLILRINNMAGWIMWVVTGIFENLGQVQEGMDTISKPHSVVDQPQAPALVVDRGEIVYENMAFHYGKDGGVIDNLSLTIKAGEKVGLVGRSGAGKSTLVNVLLRFHDLEAGRILIDGQDIARVSQESLRRQIGMVSQDTSLLHRSIGENIRYGRREASREEMLAAAKRAQAHEFIEGLADSRGRTGYDVLVGERGVKLSGGQRQRVAIARVLLKDAPILVLDEATSALDSEVEAAIQEQLFALMTGKTVIAIAHRLSTIAAMDRLVIMDKGRIIEEGSHADLIGRGGLYAELWARQSVGFLVASRPAERDAPQPYEPVHLDH